MKTFGSDGSSSGTVGYRCPNCQYQRTKDDKAPAWQCPKCEMAYAKANKPAVKTTQRGKYKIKWPTLLILFLFAAFALNYLNRPDNREFVTASHPVTLYSTVWCGYCAKARYHLNQLRVPYREYDTELTDKGRKDFSRLRGRGVPLLIVGDERMDGYDAYRLEQLLRKIGY